MLQDSSFAHDVKCRWLELREGVLSSNYLMNYIDSLSTVLDEPSIRHFSRWPILGTYVWPNNFIGNTFQEEIDYLKTWVTNRLSWMDANMFGSCDDLGISEENSLNTASLYPNPTDGRFTIAYNGVLKPQKVIITNAIGQVIKIVPLTNEFQLTFNLESHSNGLYFVHVFTTDSKYQTLKLVKQ
jgi:hypothetical protein